MFAFRLTEGNIGELDATAVYAEHKDDGSEEGASREVHAEYHSTGGAVLQLRLPVKPTEKQHMLRSK